MNKQGAVTIYLLVALILGLFLLVLYTFISFSEDLETSSRDFDELTKNFSFSINYAENSFLALVERAYTSYEMPSGKSFEDELFLVFANAGQVSKLDTNMFEKISSREFLANADSQGAYVFVKDVSIRVSHESGEIEFTGNLRADLTDGVWKLHGQDL